MIDKSQNYCCALDLNVAKDPGFEHNAPTLGDCCNPQSAQPNVGYNYQNMPAIYSLLRWALLVVLHMLVGAEAQAKHWVSGEPAYSLALDVSSMS